VRLGIVLGVIGNLLRLFALLFAFPSAVGLYYGEVNAALQFALSGAICFAIGIALSWRVEPPRVFRRSEAFGVVAGTWLLVAMAAAVPFVLDGMRPVDALFESMSGFTTTGATVLTDFGSHGNAFFFWRAFIQWLGGLGVIALFVVVLPRLGVAGRQLFFAEASGAAGEALSPQARKGAMKLWGLYGGMTVLLTGLLCWVGFGFFDALLHALTTMAAGGFSNNGASLMGFANPAAEWILIVFMTLAGASFTLQWRGYFRDPREFFRDQEFVVYVLAMALGALGVAFLVAGGLPDLDTLRAGFFQSASLISSTGFASQDYELWSDAAKVILVWVMMIGGCAGSAAGGAKVVRHILVVKFLRREITQTLHPRAVLSIRYGGREIPREILRAVFTLVFLFLSANLLLGSLILVLEVGNQQMNLATGFSCALACVGNIGPGFGAAGPMGSFAFLSDASKVALTVGMWVGRLEILAVLALLHPHVWRELRWKD
jgi:trk system potassium uptake protein TrkH